MTAQSSCVAHMHGVVAYMDEHAPDYGLAPGSMDFYKQVLQDTGYLYGKEEYVQGVTGPVPGLVSDFPYTMLVRDLQMTPSEYAAAHDIPMERIPKEQILFWEADLMVDLSGKVVGFSKRMADIAERFGINSREYKICTETTNYVIHWRATECLYSSKSAEKAVEHLLLGTY